jgi:hypothetical protein
MYAGIGVMSRALFPWLLIVAIAWFYLQYSLIVTREEQFLSEKFGAAYELYRMKVGRFIPRLIPYRSPQPPDKTVDFREGLSSERRTFQAIGLVMLLLIVLYLVKGA